MPHLLAAAILAAGAAAQEPVRPSAEDELLRLEAARSEAVRSGDLKALDAIYADDFAGVAGTGQLVTKKQLFEIFGRVEPSVRYTTSEASARVFGETGVVVGRLAGRREDGSLISEARFTHVYVRREGRFRFVAGQSTPILATPDPFPAGLPPAVRQTPRAFEEPYPPNAPGVTPPRKIHEIKPQWPPAARPREAAAALDLVIRRDGRVMIEQTRQATDPEWERACRQAVSQWRYEPASKDGMPVAVRLTVTCTMNVR
jgi:ketosteroid isomerase-like protein